MISPDSDFQWEKILPLFRVLLKPLTSWKILVSLAGKRGPCLTPASLSFFFAP